MKQKYSRLIIVILVILIIFLISNIFITREGFYSGQITSDTLINLEYVNTNNIEFFSENDINRNAGDILIFNTYVTRFNTASQNRIHLTLENFLDSEERQNSEIEFYVFLFNKHKNENDVLELNDYLNINLEEKLYFNKFIDTSGIFENRQVTSKDRFTEWIGGQLINENVNNDIKTKIQNVYRILIDNSQFIEDINVIDMNQFFVFMFKIIEDIKRDFPFYSEITTIHPVKFMTETASINQIEAYLRDQLSRRITDENKITRLVNAYKQQLLNFNNNNVDIPVGIFLYFYYTYFFAENVYRTFLASSSQDITIEEITGVGHNLFNELTNMLAFKYFDQNNDNILSRDEFLSLATFKLDTKAIFDIIDNNNDNIITRQELLAYYNNEANNFSQSEKDIAISKMRRHDVNNNNELTFAEFALSVLEPYECLHGDNSDNDCSNIRTRRGDEITIRNVCPKDPRCLGICIDDHTWTEKNKRDLGPFDSDLNVVGELKNPDMKHLISSSRCLECVKNFGTAANLLIESNSCIID